MPSLVMDVIRLVNVTNHPLVPAETINQIDSLSAMMQQ
jgi:hypothetical protein